MVQYSAWAKPVRQLFKNFVGYSMKNSVRSAAKPSVPILVKKKQPSRRLLELQIVEQAYSSLDQSNVRQQLPIVAKLDSFVQITNSLPPNWWTTSSLQNPIPLLKTQCAPVFLSYQLGSSIVHVLSNYYLFFDSEVQNLSDSLLSAFPDQHFTPNPTTASTWSKSALFFMLNLVHINLQDLANFDFKSFFYSFTYCDFESVIYCNQKQANVLPVIFYTAILYCIISYLGNILSLSFPATVFFYASPLLVMHQTYNIGYSCFPMLPTCLLDEIIYNVQVYTPAYASIPPLLLCNTSSAPYCLRSCSEFGFVKYQDPLIFWACDLGVCSAVQPLFSTQHMQELLQDKPNVPAYRFCAFVSSVLIFPILFLIAASFFLVVSVFVFFLSIIPSLMNVLWHIVLFNHS